jgi:hypothetical protein
MPQAPPPKKRKRPPSSTIHGLAHDGNTLCRKGGGNPKTTAITKEITCKSCLQSYALGDKRQAKEPKAKGEMVWVEGWLLEEVRAWLEKRRGKGKKQLKPIEGSTDVKH